MATLLERFAIGGGVASRILAVSNQTLIRWGNKGMLPFEKETNGRRLYRLKDVRQLRDNPGIPVGQTEVVNA